MVKSVGLQDCARQTYRQLQPCTQKQLPALSQNGLTTFHQRVFGGALVWSGVLRHP